MSLYSKPAPRCAVCGAEVTPGASDVVKITRAGASNVHVCLGCYKNSLRGQRKKEAADK